MVQGWTVVSRQSPWVVVSLSTHRTRAARDDAVEGKSVGNALTGGGRGSDDGLFVAVVRGRGGRPDRQGAGTRLRGRTTVRE